MRPDAFGPFAFATMNLILDVIEEVSPSRKAVVKRMENIKDYECIVGSMTTFDEHGQEYFSGHYQICGSGRKVGPVEGFGICLRKTPVEETLTERVERPVRPLHLPAFPVFEKIFADGYWTDCPAYCQRSHAGIDIFPGGGRVYPFFRGP